MERFSNSTPENAAAPNGPFWAGVLATGIGCVALGALVDLAEASKAVSKALNLYNPTGDLSGKSIVALAAWGIAWALLHAWWRRREIRSPRWIMVITLVLIVLGFVAVFPPFFEVFAVK